FALWSTLGKMANIASEVGELDRAAEGILKAFTSGDRIFIDRKGIPGIHARPTARLVLATNNLPRFSDRSKALWRRMIVMPFNKEISKSERILGMDKPEYWQDELDAIFTCALKGLARLRDRGHFSDSALCEEALTNYQRDCNPARVFLEETCETSETET